MPARAAGFFVEFSTAMLNRIFTDDDLAAVRAGSVLAAFFRISAVTAFSPDDHRLSLHAEELRGKSEKFRRERLASRAMLADFLRSTAENPLPPFSFGRYGRPYFTGSGMPFFSISHSGEHILLTMSKKPVGADVEAIRLRKGAQGIADRYFTPAEAGCVRKYGQRVFSDCGQSARQYRNSPEAVFRTSPVSGLIQEDSPFLLMTVRILPCLSSLRLSR